MAYVKYNRSIWSALCKIVKRHTRKECGVVAEEGADWPLTVTSNWDLTALTRSRRFNLYDHHLFILHKISYTVRVADGQNTQTGSGNTRRHRTALVFCNCEPLAFSSRTLSSPFSHPRVIYFPLSHLKTCFCLFKQVVRPSITRLMPPSRKFSFHPFATSRWNISFLCHRTTRRGTHNLIYYFHAEENINWRFLLFPWRFLSS